MSLNRDHDPSSDFNIPLPFPPEAIREHLKRILASSEFQSSAMLRNFLSHVVEKTLAGQAEEIKG